MEIMVVVIAIGVLAAIAIPSLIRSRATAQQNGCVNNLRMMDAAITVWADESAQLKGTPVTGGVNGAYTVFLKTTSNGQVPACPAQGTYSVGNVGDVPQVSCSLSTAKPPHLMP